MLSSCAAAPAIDLSSTAYPSIAFEPIAAAGLAITIAPNAVSRREYGSGSPNFSFAFFNNAILGSRALAHIVVDNAVTHMVFLDLPAGSYVMDDFQFAFLSQAGASTIALRKKLAKPVLLEVPGERAVYLGRLGVWLTNLRATGAFGQPIAAGNGKVIRIGVFDTADLDLAATVIQAADEDLLKAKTRYRALADQPFARGTMAIGR